MEKRIECTQQGIYCDAPGCGWAEPNVLMADYDAWVDRPCPQCGANLLTLEDHLRSNQLHEVIEYLNSLSEVEMAILAAEAKDNTEVKDLLLSFGIDIATQQDGDMYVQVQVHEGVHIRNIEIVPTDDNADSNSEV